MTYDPLQAVAKTRARARSLGLVGLALFVGAFLVPADNDDLAAVLLLVGVVLLAVALFLWFRLRGHVTDAIEETGALEGDRVLYLRPFGQDDEKAAIVQWLGNPASFLMLFRPIGLLRWLGLIVTARWGWEQALKAATRKVGKLVALGEPGERLPTAGLMNEYLPHDGWRDRVIELVDASKMVIMRAGVSDSVMWEIGTVVPRVDPEMMLIYVSPKSGLWKDLGVTPGAREPERAEYYEAFRDKAAGLFPKGLPPELGRSRFIRFESDWTPVAHEKAWYGLDRPPAVHVANYMESVLL